MVHKLRAGIIGLGNVAIHHLEAYRAWDNWSVVAAAETRPDRLQALSSQFGFKGYQDYKKMLEEEELDLAIVLTPVNTHREVAEEAALRGIHVFTEKPMAIQLEDAEAMSKFPEKYGIKLFYGSSYRFLPAIQYARELIQSGEIGEVQNCIEILLGGKGPENQYLMSEVHYPTGGPGGSGMGLVDHGIHLMDIFPWLCDSPIKSVFGRGNRTGKESFPEFLFMEMEKDITGHLLYNDMSFSTDLPNEGLFSWGGGWNVAGDFSPPGTWHDQPGNIRVLGSKGALRIFHYANRLFLADKNGQKEIALPNTPPPQHFGIQMNTFVQNILQDEEPAVNAKDGLNALKVLLACYESWEQRKIIEIK